MRIKVILNSETLKFQEEAEEVSTPKLKLHQKFLTMRANYQTIVTVLEN